MRTSNRWVIPETSFARGAHKGLSLNPPSEVAVTMDQTAMLAVLRVVKRVVTPLHRMRVTIGTRPSFRAEDYGHASGVERNGPRRRPDEPMVYDVYQGGIANVEAVG